MAKSLRESFRAVRGQQLFLGLMDYLGLFQLRIKPRNRS
jgi:hypothetical protein